MFFVFFFKQKTAYEMRISDWSSDVCSSDLGVNLVPVGHVPTADGALGVTAVTAAVLVELAHGVKAASGLAVLVGLRVDGLAGGAVAGCRVEPLRILFRAVMLTGTTIWHHSEHDNG